MLETKDLTFSYQNDAPLVLDGVDLNVREGEFLVILGRNGSGKSTLAKHFNAILLPSGGTVTVLGMDTADENLLFDIRQAVGMVFQNPDNQIVATVVEEDVACALENLGVPSAEIRRRVEEALETVGMLEYRKHAASIVWWTETKGGYCRCHCNDAQMHRTGRADCDARSSWAARGDSYCP